MRPVLSLSLCVCVCVCVCHANLTYGILSKEKLCIWQSRPIEINIPEVQISNQPSIKPKPGDESARAAMVSGFFEEYAVLISEFVDETTGGL